jgi:hypothetical protein
MFEAEREREEKDCVLKAVRTGKNVGQGDPDCTRIRKHSTSQRVTHAQTSPGTREERMESAESEDGQLQRVNAWVVEVREDGMRCIDLSTNDVYGDGDTF